MSENSTSAVQIEISEIQPQPGADAQAALDRTAAELKNRAQRRTAAARANKAAALLTPSPAQTMTAAQLAHRLCKPALWIYAQGKNPDFPRAIRLDPRNPRSALRYLESDVVTYLRKLQDQTAQFRVGSGGDPNAAVDDQHEVSGE